MERGIIAKVAQSLTTEEPKSKGPGLAAVSIILRDSESPSVLLIRRSERAGDPWSGQVAFPGGKFQEGDKSVRDTAVRETREEVGIDLDSSSQFLGYFRSFRTHTGTMDVVPTLFKLNESVAVRPNNEVASYAWVGVGELISAESKFAHILNFGGESREMPAIKIGDFVIWGLTHRIISDLMLDSPS